MESTRSAIIQGWLERGNTVQLNKDHALLMEVFPTMTLYDVLEWHTSRTYERLFRHIEDAEVDHHQVQGSIVKWFEGWKTEVKV